MTLYDAVRTELLTMRKRADGVTVGALARADTIRQLLGGGDPRVAYNALMHILIEGGGDLPLEAISYSLGYASDGPTHLARLQDFGRDKGYDQRQARRYSDRGLDQLARAIATEWTIEGSPTLTVALLGGAGVVECVIIARHLNAIEMRMPELETVHLESGTRIPLHAEWRHVATEGHQQWSASVEQSVDLALSILWKGELWPQFTLQSSETKLGLHLQTLAARATIAIARAETATLSAR